VNFSLHHRVQTKDGAHPASYPMGTRCSFPGSKAAGLEADHSPPFGTAVKECMELYLHSSNTPSWHGVPLKKAQGQLYLYVYLTCVEKQKEGRNERWNRINPAVERQKEWVMIKFTLGLPSPLTKEPLVYTEYVLKRLQNHSGQRGKKIPKPLPEVSKLGPPVLNLSLSWLSSYTNCC
jgi:hypothetical protein